MCLNKFLYKIFYLSIFTSLLLCPGRADAYRVSGVVAFTYNADEYRTGNQRTTSHFFTQNYIASLQNYLWDPRFLRYQAGVSYNIISSSLSENKGLSYDLNMNFFPGMMISWDLYDRKSTSKMSTNENIAGYDLTTISYGGSMKLNLSRKGGRNNNHNNNNNNNNYNNNYNNNSNNNSNNNGSRFHFRLPDIGLLYGHVESDSQGAQYPIKESRDNVGLSIAYRINAQADLNMSQTTESYKNFINGAQYDTTSTSLASKILVSPDADLDLSGSRIERTTTGFAGLFALHDTIWSSAATLNFKERDGIRHGYNYGFTKSQSDYADRTNHHAAATVSYQIHRDLSLRGGLNYAIAEYFAKARAATLTSAATPESKQNLESGGAQTGVAYRKLYTPDFLGPFAMNTDYSFNTGYTKITSSQANEEVGSGLYYENSAAIGFTSIEWKKDSLFAGYNISSRRDRSPLSNNIRHQSFRLDASTYRIPQATVRANVSYTVTESSVSGANSVFVNSKLNNSGRSLFYQISALYAVSPSLSVDAGASQGYSSNSAPTLSTLQPNMTAPVEQMAYIGAHYVNAITRNLMYRANVRDEYRSSFRVKTETRNVDMGLDYRIRQVLVNFTYRWTEMLPENGLNTYLQSYMVKLSRPF